MKQINQIAIKQGGVPNARGACTHDDNSLGAKSRRPSNALTPIIFEINRREQKKWLLSPLGRQRPALSARVNWGANCLDAGWSRFCQDLGNGSPSQVHHRRSVDRVKRCSKKMLCGCLPGGRSASQTGRVATCDHSHVWSVQEAFLLFPSVNFEDDRVRAAPSLSTCTVLEVY